MKFIIVATLLLGVSANVHARVENRVTPIQKVIQMLGELASKGKTEKHNEEVEFAKFKTWCEDVINDKTKDISEGAASIEQLTADINKAESDAKILGDEIAGLRADVDTFEKELQNATAIRKQEKADYMAQHTDYSESIDAIERAINVLRQRSADIPQSLLQLRKSSLIPAGAKAAIESFLAFSMDATQEVEAPEANAYENQSGGVVAVLEKLLTKFQDERFALEKAEMNANANYELLAQKLTAQIDDGKDAIATKTTAKTGRLDDAASAKGDLGTTETTKAQDEKTLSETKAECHTESEEFEKNQNTRADEVEAIEKAIEIMSSPAVSGNAEKHLPTLVQAEGSSLAQLRGDVAGSGQAAAAAYLQRKAKSLGSRYLALVAARAGSDPFVKVRKMIKDLIVKLMEEANAEADHKAFCDTELATNKQTRENLSAEVDKLQANIDDKTAENEQLATDIATLSDAIAESKKQQAEATSMRAEEKEKNAATVTDAKDAQAAVEAALKVLKDFYNKAADASLLQSSEPYKGMQDESTGVIGMLEVILSDFARLESGTSSSEDAAQADYEKFMNNADEDNAVKQAEVDHKTEAKLRCDEALAQLKADLDHTQEQLTAALDYFEKLKPDCVDLGLSYEDRVQRRKEEIVSLQEALRILNGEDLR